MTTIFGRNRGLASGPAGDLPVESQRFHALVSENGRDMSVYDAFTGRYAPFYGDTALSAAADLNAATFTTDDFQWEDHL